MNYIDYALDPEELAYIMFMLDNSIDSLKDVLGHINQKEFDDKFYDACRAELRIARRLKAKLNPKNLRLTLDKEKDIPPKVYTS